MRALLVDATSIVLADSGFPRPRLAEWLEDVSITGDRAVGYTRGAGGAKAEVVASKAPTGGTGGGDHADDKPAEAAKGRPELTWEFRKVDGGWRIEWHGVKG